jgi:hypothetical protein
LNIVVRNSGSTPALEVNSRATVQFLTGERRELPSGFVFDEKEVDFDGPRFIGPQTEGELSFPLPENRIRAAQSNIVTMVTLIRLRYVDIFNEPAPPHETVEALRYEPGPKGHFAFRAVGDFSRMT